MIVKVKDGYQVQSKSGKILGTHKSKKDALKQLAAVEISKLKRSSKSSK